MSVQPVAPGADSPSSSPSAWTSVTDRELHRSHLHRRTLIVVVLSQVLGGAGLAAGVTVGSLLAQQILGGVGWAGLPSALFTAGSAAAAWGVGRLSNRSGRRIGLSVGYVLGAVGGVGVVVATLVDSVLLFLVSLTVYGSGTATNLQSRYAGADLATPSTRGRAVSTVLVATTAGAVAGPLLVEPIGRVADQFGVTPLAGPFAFAALAYASAAGVLVLFLRPDPLLVARELAAGHTPAAATSGFSLDGTQGTNRRTLLTAATAMVLTQLVMVAVMTMTPIHLRAHGHSLHAVGVVIAVHIASMYLPSPLTGWLADRYGRVPMLVAAGVVLLAAGLIAALAPVRSVPTLAVALALLGLGWNLGLVGGTALVTDATGGADRAKVQGNIDVSVALSGATAGLASGAVVAASTYPTLALGSGALALLIIPVTVSGSRSVHSQ